MGHFRPLSGKGRAPQAVKIPPNLPGLRAGAALAVSIPGIGGNFLLV
jgi:hypothetical protein